MSTHHGGNDGNVPPDGDRTPDPDLPEVPPDWEVAIPDDPSELATEAEQVQEELLRERREASARARSGGAATGEREPSIGAPLLIMSVAVLITLVSLFAMAWSGAGSVPTGGSGDGSSELPPITLLDSSGRQVALTAQTPVVIMLVEECGCPNLIADTAHAAPPGVTVAAVSHSPPEVPGGLSPSDPRPLLLADPGGRIRAELDLDAPTDAATVVMVDQAGQITETHLAATSVAQYQGDLTDLAA